MPRRVLTILLFSVSLLLMAACAVPVAQPAPATAVAPTAVAPVAEEAQEATAEVTATWDPNFEASSCPFEMPPGVVEGERITCGYVSVPEDHDNPGGEAIRLAVVVVKDQSEGHQPDPVILLNGGPGEKMAVNAVGVASLMVPHFPNRDFIVFDQRGVGTSDPALECPEWEEAQLDVLNEIDLVTRLDTSFGALMDCRDRLVAEGHNLSAFNTLQNAADVDAIRRSLGYDQINLFGGSYGSYLAQQVAKAFPDSIRSMALGAIWPLEQSFFMDSAEVTTVALLKMVESCSADPACDEAFPDLKETLFEVVAELDASPVPVTLTNPADGQNYESFLSGKELVNGLITFLYITPLIPSLPQAIYDVSEGDYELISDLSGLTLSLLDASSRGMLFSTVCAEDLIDKLPEDLLASRANLPPELMGDIDEELVIKYGIFGICENWPVDTVDPSFKTPLVSDIPTLMLEGEFDPVTPTDYAYNVAEYLSDSHVFEFPAIGHNVLASDRCPLEMAGAFIANPTQAPDATCLAAMPEMAFDLPGAEIALNLQPFVDEERGFQGVIPEGWQEVSPANLARKQSALDPAYFVLEAAPMAQNELFDVLKRQLSLPDDVAVASREWLGQFTWDLYSVEVGGNPTDLAMTEGGGKTYFILLISPADEHDELYENLFLPAVEAIQPLS